MLDYNDPDLGLALVERIFKIADKISTMNIMEVCGTHTMAVGRFGIRRLLPPGIRLVSGPGCPVCVTPGEYIDNAVQIALENDVTVATFGDMVRVPGNKGSLEQARSEGAGVKVITNPFDILEIKGEVLFLSVGFETTMAPIAAFADHVINNDLDRISFYTSLKLIPPTLKALLSDPEIKIDGFLLPGHVSTIIGSKAYDFLNVPSWIAGFEMIDILNAVMNIMRMKAEGKNLAVNGYGRAVKPEGNPKAVSLINKIFEPSDQIWRGIGELPQCSLKMRSEFAKYDAEIKYSIDDLSTDNMPKGCSCGSVLKGTKTPDQCALFATTCIPDHPAGPCMVSSEGACAAFYKYERIAL